MTSPQGTGSRPAAAPRSAAVAIVLAGWIVLVAGTAVWGALGGAGRRAMVGAPPFMGTWRFAPTWRVLPAALLAAGTVTTVLPWFRRAPWRRVLLAATTLAVAWAVALAFIDGWDALTTPLETRYEYLQWVSRVGSPGVFLENFVEQLPRVANHVKTHPPGMVLTLWCLEWMGLGGSGPAAALILGAAGAGVAAVLVASRDVAGEAAARAAAPFVALLPAAVWMATSADALFFGVTACGVAAVVTATSRRGRRSILWAGVGGFLLAAGAFFSYGMVAVLPLAAAVVVARRRWHTGLAAALAMAGVFAAFAAAGFWWPDGLAAMRERYAVGIVAARSDSYFRVANLAVLAVAVGPAVAVGLLRARGPQLILCGTVLATLVAIDLVGFSEGEVERIWLPFFPWLATAAASLEVPTSRHWLAINAATGLVVQLFLRSPW